MQWVIYLGVALTILRGHFAFASTDIFAINSEELEQNNLFSQNPLNIPQPSDLQPQPPSPPIPETPIPVLEDPIELPTVDRLSCPKPTANPEGDRDTIVIQAFEFTGNTAFDGDRLARELAGYTNIPITFAQLLQAKSCLTDLYVREGYITTGAFLPANLSLGQVEAAIVPIKIVEGRLSEIKIDIQGRLDPSYIRSRLQLATHPPLHRDRLLEALKLLQLDPLIQSLSAELATGIDPGTNVLYISAVAANPWTIAIDSNNSRSPSIGSFRRGASIGNGNFIGIGDRLALTYSNTDGSNSFDISYALPLSPHNTLLQFNFGTATSTIIESPFDRLNIDASSQYYQLTLRHPLQQTPTEELALSVVLSHTRGATTLQDIPFPLSPGADIDGKTNITALRFIQEWTKRDTQQVFALRSQFSLGIDALGSTIQRSNPDSNFFAWQGQGQWVRQLGTNTTAPTILLRGGVQLSDRPLLSGEQFGLGGFGSVRGYRQDSLLTDNGIFASAEIRIPILKLTKAQTTVQIIPFIEGGMGWNSGDSETPDPNTLAAVGVGLQVLQGDRFNARLDWGLPLVDILSSERTWQENGIYFYIQYNF
ncbi:MULTISPECIES: ShlB/FhaC/HecB family hemolysin secretion/activation protein [Spirulina sp. CCY15215]|uniref:ShlB/FhaC/HecB family hemolysin secretion/activation protein n=1 Tax=Spirulina sp. CCY15215 TaxID=2767591 RepID=UPI00194E2A33|nr:ShlB/FhaC/HecB family hemolysin secretion/activation protein [Spirulina major]